MADAFDMMSRINEAKNDLVKLESGTFDETKPVTELRDRLDEADVGGAFKALSSNKFERRSFERDFLESVAEAESARRRRAIDAAFDAYDGEAGQGRRFFAAEPYLLSALDDDFPEVVFGTPGHAFMASDGPLDGVHDEGLLGDWHRVAVSDGSASELRSLPSTNAVLAKRPVTEEMLDRFDDTVMQNPQMISDWTAKIGERTDTRVRTDLFLRSETNQPDISKVSIAPGVEASVGDALSMRAALRRPVDESFKHDMRSAVIESCVFGQQNQSQDALKHIFSEVRDGIEGFRWDLAGDAMWMGAPEDILDKQTYKVLDNAGYSAWKTETPAVVIGDGRHAFVCDDVSALNPQYESLNAARQNMAEAVQAKSHDGRFSIKTVEDEFPLMAAGIDFSAGRRQQRAQENPQMSIYDRFEEVLAGAETTSATSEKTPERPARQAGSQSMVDQSKLDALHDAVSNQQQSSDYEFGQQ